MATAKCSIFFKHPKKQLEDYPLVEFQKKGTTCITKKTFERHLLNQRHYVIPVHFIFYNVYFISYLEQLTSISTSINSGSNDFGKILIFDSCVSLAPSVGKRVSQFHCANLHG